MFSHKCSYSVGLWQHCEKVKSLRIWRRSDPATLKPQNNKRKEMQKQDHHGYDPICKQTNR